MYRVWLQAWSIYLIENATHFQCDPVFEFISLYFFYVFHILSSPLNISAIEKSLRFSMIF